MGPATQEAHRRAWAKTQNFLQKISKTIWAPMAHTYNPSYSGCRDQEDRSSKPAQENSS
jgi:hypothetical protein